MAGSAIEIRGEELERMSKRLGNFFRRVIDDTSGMRVISGILESQTKRRISDEKEGPQGRDWEPWSEKYAKTRHSRHSLLQNRNQLYKSIKGDFGSGFAQTYTELVYGRVHQDGRTSVTSSRSGGSTVDIPARPFMGLSRDNQKEVEEVFADWVEGRL